jgi:hypothetical protein
MKTSEKQKMRQTKEAVGDCQAVAKTHSILESKNYHMVDCVAPPSRLYSHWLRLEIWTGPKGVLIVQVWKDDNGCSTYANWPTGNTFDELEAML